MPSKSKEYTVPGGLGEEHFPELVLARWSGGSSRFPECQKGCRFGAGDTKSATAGLSYEIIPPLIVYPNPVDDRLVLKGNPSWDAITRISIRNLQGGLALETRRDGEGIAAGKPINTSSIPDGIYLLTIEFDDQAAQHHKLIIEH